MADSMMFDEDDAPEVSHPEDAAAALFVESVYAHDRDVAEQKSDAEIGVKDRMSYIGGSDVPAILGISPWKSAFEVYLEKTAQKRPDDLSGIERVRWGTILEEIVAREYAERTGRSLRRVNRLIRSKSYPFMAAHIDRNVLNERGILECKTAGVMQAKYWGEEGTDQIPDHYLPQVMHYLYVTEADWCDVAVLIGGNDFRIYRIEKDEEYFAFLVEAELEFWARVVELVPPAVGNAAEAKMAWPRTKVGTVAADDEAYRAWKQLADVTRDVAVLEERSDELKAVMMAQMKDIGDTLVYDGKTLATWKEQKGRTSVDQKKLEKEFPEVYAACAKPGDPYRVFRPKFEK